MTKNYVKKYNNSEKVTNITLTENTGCQKAGILPVKGNYNQIEQEI